jgi:organic hydroperoxide reductase OsmC/OhrA
MSEITLIPSLTIFREEDREKAIRILNKSEESCLISNSVRSKIVMTAEIKVG